MVESSWVKHYCHIEKKLSHSLPGLLQGISLRQIDYLEFSCVLKLLFY